MRLFTSLSLTGLTIVTLAAFAPGIDNSSFDRAAPSTAASLDMSVTVPALEPTTCIHCFYCILDTSKHYTELGASPLIQPAKRGVHSTCITNPLSTCDGGHGACEGEGGGEEENLEVLQELLARALDGDGNAVYTIAEAFPRYISLNQEWGVINLTACLAEGREGAYATLDAARFPELAARLAAR